MATLSLIRESEMHRKLRGDGTEKREAGHPELMFAQRDPRSVCSREFYFFVIHDAPIVTMRAGSCVLMSCFAHGAGDAARLAWGNRATVCALHLEYSGANFATAEFPANGGLRKRQKLRRR